MQKTPHVLRGRGGFSVRVSPVICDYCKKQIGEHDRFWSEVRGWISSKGQKGFTIDEHLEGRLHTHCMDLKKAGVIPGQADIFGSYSDDSLLT